jgi:hypothetical protein
MRQMPLPARFLVDPSSFVSDTYETHTFGKPAANVRPMNSYDTPETVAAIDRLKQEIERLTEQQSEALKTATYVGMTAAEARSYDARRQQITKLVEELTTLKESPLE